MKMLFPPVFSFLALYLLLCYNRRAFYFWRINLFMFPIVSHATLGSSQRMLIVSDIHAHKDLFARLLEKAQYTPSEDILVIVGDMLEKGPQNLETLRFVKQLVENKNVYPLIGNVDDWRLHSLISRDEDSQKAFVKNSIQYLKWWEDSWLNEMCREIGEELTEEMDVQRVFPLLQQHFKPEIDFLCSLPAILETENIIFVHGGIPHEDTDKLNQTENRHQFLKYDHFMEEGLAFHKYVAVGHWPTVLYCPKIPNYLPIIDHKRHIISLDGGCGVKSEGQLNMVILPGGDVEKAQVLYADELPVVTARDSQQESRNAHHIHWGDHYITLLEKGEAMSRILFHGDEMQVPTQLLWEDNGQMCCNDISDYQLPVVPGDHLSVIFTLPHGVYAKKDGIHGWYTGRYE